MAKSQKANNSLAVVTIGKTVPDALIALKAELRNLTEITESSYKTGGDGKVTNFPNSIQNETSIEKLIQMYSSVKGRSEAYNNAQAEIAQGVGGKFQAPVFRDNGQTSESILSDIILRIKVLSVSERKAKLEKLISEAQGFMSKDDQFKMWQANLAQELGLTEAGDNTEDAETV